VNACVELGKVLCIVWPGAPQDQAVWKGFDNFGHIDSFSAEPGAGMKQGELR
jgi:hypothetical protein